MILFSTVAANADVLGDDAPLAEPRRKPGETGGKGAAGDDRPEREGVRRESDGSPESGAAEPGQDINAPGFIRKPDAGEPG